MCILSICVVKTLWRSDNKQRIKAINNCESHIEKIMFFVTAGFKQKYIETSFKNFGLNLTNFHQIIGHEEIQNNVYNLL